MDGEQITDNRELLKNGQCYLCLEEYDDPRLLDCCHSFCKNCLDGYLETFDGDSIDCPLCDQKTNRPKSAKYLKKNIYFQLTSMTFGVTCSVCGENDYAKSHCLECNQDFCRGCIKSHGGITATREHHLVSLEKKKASGRVLKDIYCKIHTEEKMAYFCVECEKLICKHCNLTTHKNHVSKHTSEVATGLRENLLKDANSRENRNYITWLEERRKLFSKEIDKCKEIEKDAISNIKDQTDKMIASVTELKNILVKKAGRITKKKIHPLKEKISLFEKYTRSFSELLQYSHNLYNQADDLEIVDTSPTLMKILKNSTQHKKHPHFEIGEFCIFKPGKVTTDKLLPYFGDVQVGDLYEGTCKTIYEFSLERSDTILSIIPQIDDRVWIVDGDNNLKLYDTAGRIHRKLKLNVNIDDIFATDEHYIISGNSTKQIKVFDKHLREVSSVKTELCCRGIAYDSQDKSIYTCLTEKNAFFDHDPTHKNKIVRIMATGAGDYSNTNIREFIRSPTIEYPARIAIIKEGQIVISDWKRNCITILNKSGYIENEVSYTAIEKSDETFCPRGICTDKRGGLYVADYNNSQILKLTDDCKELKVHLSKQDGIRRPWSVACGEDDLLWIGNKSGKISVHYFKRKDHSLYKND